MSNNTERKIVFTCMAMLSAVSAGLATGNIGVLVAVLSGLLAVGMALIE